MSCWVMVEAPRSDVSPPVSEPALAFWAIAAMIATGSKPSFFQKVRSSAVVVASRISCGTSSKDTTRRASRWKRASSTVPVRS